MISVRSEGLAIAVWSALIGAPMAAQSAAWIQAANSGPQGRYSAAMAYDEQRGRTVLFGGQLNGGTGSDTWEWNGTQWLPMTYLVPSNGQAMVYDVQRGRSVLFGVFPAGDIWEWNGSSWTQATIAGPRPSLRTGFRVAYDSRRGRTVMFGGSDSSGHMYGDTWEWDGNTWTQVAIVGPAARSLHAMAYDSQRGRTVMFGGAGLSTYFSDTWEWDGSNWTQMASNAPTSGGPMTYDSQRGRTVMFEEFYSGNTWEWDGGTWTLLVTGGPAGPASRSGVALVYDSRRGRTVLFGGYYSGWPHFFFGDTWELGLIGSASPFGTGCGSPALDLSPVANARPIINRTAQASLNNVPSPPSLAFVSLGLSRSMFGPVPLPMTLAGLGMPGCDLLQSAEMVAQSTTATGPGTATFGLALPNLATLIGVHVFLQAWALAPGANTGQVIVSNGLDWAIGNL